MALICEIINDIGSKSEKKGAFRDYWNCVRRYISESPTRMKLAFCSMISGVVFFRELWDLFQEDWL